MVRAARTELSVMAKIIRPFASALPVIVECLMIPKEDAPLMFVNQATTAGKTRSARSPAKAFWTAFLPAMASLVALMRSALPESTRRFASAKKASKETPTT